MNQENDFLSALLDFSFTEFVSVKLIKVIYGVSIAFAGLVALVFVINGFASGIGIGLASLLLAPVMFVILVVLSRVWLEVTVVLFRIADHAADVAEALAGPDSQASDPI